MHHYGSGGFHLDGELAAELYGGGRGESLRVIPPDAAPKSGLNGADAMRLARRFCDDLTEMRYEDFVVLRSDGAWSGFFFGSIHDRTWMIIDRRDQLVTLICVSSDDGG